MTRSVIKTDTTLLEMRIVDIQYAEANLSQLVDKAAKGESFIIAKAGVPLVKVQAPGAEKTRAVKRIGFMLGEVAAPADFERTGDT
jgi:antitoxin (DNA-binding transcriptional repressor) of toxin-antitoxin stability system